MQKPGLDIEKPIEVYQSVEELQEVLLQELESLFDRPYLVPAQGAPAEAGIKGPAPFKIGLEKDYSNTFLVTNPLAIFRVFQKEQFLGLPEST